MKEKFVTVNGEKRFVPNSYWLPCPDNIGNVDYGDYTSPRFPNPERQSIHNKILEDGRFHAILDDEAEEIYVFETCVREGKWQRDFVCVMDAYCSGYDELPKAIIAKLHEMHPGLKGYMYVDIPDVSSEEERVKRFKELCQG